MGNEASLEGEAGQAGAASASAPPRAGQLSEPSTGARAAPGPGADRYERRLHAFFVREQPDALRLYRAHIWAYNNNTSNIMTVSFLFELH